MVGCDHILKSKKVKDRCGVCDGNGDSCSLVTSSYTEDYTTCKPIYIITHILNGLLYYIFLLEYSTRLIEIVCPQSQKGCLQSQRITPVLDYFYRPPPPPHSSPLPFTPYPVWDASPSQSYPSILVVERQCESKASCPKRRVTQ